MVNGEWAMVNGEWSMVNYYLTRLIDFLDVEIF